MNGARHDDRALGRSSWVRADRADRRLRIARSRIGKHTVTACPRKWLRALVSLASDRRPLSGRSRAPRENRCDATTGGATGGALRHWAGSTPPAKANQCGYDRIRTQTSPRGGASRVLAPLALLLETHFGRAKTRPCCAAHRRGGLTGRPRARLGQRSGQLTMRSSSASGVTSSSRSLTRPRTETPA